MERTSLNSALDEKAAMAKHGGIKGPDQRKGQQVSGDATGLYIAMCVILSL